MKHVDFVNIFTQMLILFMLMGIGYISNKAKILTRKENKILSKLVLSIGVPGMILASVSDGSPFSSRADLVTVLLILSIVNLILPIVSIINNKLLRVKEDQSLYKFMFIFPNAGFIGFPVINAVFGPNALIYASLFQLPHNVLMYTYGLYLISGGRHTKTSIKDFFNPCIIAALIAVILCLLDIKQPYFIAQVETYLGNITTPMGMLIIGSSLADVDMKTVFSDLKVIPFIFLKLLLLPVAIYFICKPFIQNILLLQVITTILAMPTATNAVIMTNMYDGNIQLSSKTVFLTTVCSLLSIPLLCVLLF